METSITTQIQEMEAEILAYQDRLRSLPDKQPVERLEIRRKLIKVLNKWNELINKEDELKNQSTSR